VVEWDDICGGIAGDACLYFSTKHVVTAASWSNVGPDTRLDGFIITGGFAPDAQRYEIPGGGGMLLRYDASPTISNCVFRGNSARLGGALAVAVYGGREPALVNCTFVDNQAAVGGAVHVSSGDLLLVNCLFSRNSAHEGPGSAVHGASRLVNCTLVDNFSVNDGIAAYSVAEIVNSIVWGNGASPVVGAGSVSHSCVEGGHDGEGNIDAAPLFADGADGDYRPRHGSPGIDAGLDGALPGDRADLDGDLDTDEPTPRDLELKGRVLGAAVDMGAYEFCRHDLDGDGTVAVGDFLVLLSAWGPNPGHEADFDDSGRVNVNDVLILLARWGPCL
jgi:hypothetical protein